MHRLIFYNALTLNLVPDPKVSRFLSLSTLSLHVIVSACKVVDLFFPECVLNLKVSHAEQIFM